MRKEGDIIIMARKVSQRTKDEIEAQNPDAVNYLVGALHALLWALEVIDDPIVDE